MGKIKNAIYKFMYGRYGNDTLNKTLLWSYVVLMLTYMVVILFAGENALVHFLYLVLSWAIVGITFFRSMSRNIVKRRRENEKFTSFFKLIRNKRRDRKTHVYRKCPACKITLRLPKAKGKHTVVCPKCRNRFEVRG